MTLTVECAQLLDGNWFAEVPQLPGVQAHGVTRDAATQGALSLAYRLLEDESRAGVSRVDSEMYGRQSERGSNIATAS